MKKILRIASYPTIQESGRGLHCYQISKLEKFQVIYLTWFNSKTKPFKVPDGVKLYVSKFYNVENPRYGTIIQKIIFHSCRLYRILTFSFYGIYLMLKYNVNYVHIHSPMFFIVSIFSKLLGKKNIITFHGADFFRIEKAWWYSKISYCFDLVFSISPRYLTTLKKLHNCNVIQIYNGINLDIYKNYSLKRNKQILAVANFKPQKGLKFLVSGFNKFIKKYPMYDNYKLIIAGKGILFDDVKSQVVKLGIESNVSLIGQQNRDELIQLYNKSEIFILSSIWEGFAKVLMEAMACGCKVISTKVDSAPLLLDDWGLMIEHSNSDQICSYIRKSISEKYDFEKQEKYVQKFTWDKVREIYIQKIKFL